MHAKLSKDKDMVLLGMDWRNRLKYCLACPRYRLTISVGDDRRVIARMAIPSVVYFCCVSPFVNVNLCSTHDVDVGYRERWVILRLIGSECMGAWVSVDADDVESPSNPMVGRWGYVQAVAEVEW